MDLEQLIGEVEAQVAADLRSLLDESLCERKVRLERLRDLVAVADSITVRELEERKVTDVRYGSTTSQWIAHACRISASSARRQVKTAAKLGRLLPEVLAAWAAGSINEEHVRVFHQAANPRIGEEIAIRQGELIALAGRYSFHHWRQIMANLVAVLDQDGAFDPDAETERNTAQFAETLDGSCSLSARFDRVTYATIRHLVDAKADELHRHYAHRTKISDGELPTPSRPTLRALAIFELITAGAAAGTASATVTDATVVLTPDLAGTTGPTCGADHRTAPPGPDADRPVGAHADSGSDHRPAPTAAPPVTAAAPSSAAEPSAGLAPVGWRAWTLDGLLLPGASPQLAANLCDARFQALVLDLDGLPLAMGRAVRLFEPHQRRAIAIRDGGCVMPGCTLPVSASDIHHVQHWDRDQGPTDVPNGAGLCRRDHAVAHRPGWDLFITADGWPWFRTPTGHTFWGQRHGHQRTGPTPDHPDFVTYPVEPIAARPPPSPGDAPPAPSSAAPPSHTGPTSAAPNPCARRNTPEHQARSWVALDRIQAQIRAELERADEASTIDRP